ncbi:MAG: GtrA family protein [Castellaniella sp.]|uniref:GtrA family protein n=1 Tax=Castellaniella sp. TaxID=1955812 RepID=UPI0011F4D614|nr:GtrA family protein [Castellaniella sp.]TAN27941.1 MAG: GtrA family protein [Castellaniella sp.]
MQGLRREFVRYFAVSLLALVVDTALLLYLARVVHWNDIVAATISFLVGSVVHYLLAIRLVFTHRRFGHRATAEGVLYVVIGMIGLIVNDAVIYAGVNWLQAPLLMAKMAAAGGSFMVGYVGRKVFLFGADVRRAVE